MERIQLERCMCSSNTTGIPFTRQDLLYLTYSSITAVVEKTIPINSKI